MLARNVVRGLSLVILLLAACGCGKRMMPLAGVVRVDGKPIKKGTTVMFAGGDGVRPATGVTDEDGKFQLSTNQTGDGIMYGEYKVIVLSADNYLEVPRNGAPTERGGTAFDAYKKSVDEMRNRPQKKGMLPLEYANPQTTPLKWRVPEDGTEAVFDIKTSDAPAKP